MRTAVARRLESCVSLTAGPCRPRFLFPVAATIAAAVLQLVAAAPSARADTAPAGATVVGTVVRAYVEHRGEQDAGARSDFGAPLTFIDSPAGTTVRVPTPALADVPVGATVAVRVGREVADSASTTDHLDPA